MEISQQEIRLFNKNCKAEENGMIFIEKLINKLILDDESMLFSGNLVGGDPRFETRALFLDLSRLLYYTRLD